MDVAFGVWTLRVDKGLKNLDYWGSLWTELVSKGTARTFATGVKQMHTTR